MINNPFEEKIKFIDILNDFIRSNHHILSRDFENISDEIEVYIKNKKKFKDVNDYSSQVLLSKYPDIFLYLERLYYAISQEHRPLDEKKAKFLRYHLVPEIAKNVLSSQGQSGEENWFKNIFNKMDSGAKGNKWGIKVLSFSFWTGLNVYEVGFELEKALPKGWNYNLVGMCFIPDFIASAKNAVFPASLFPPSYPYKDHFSKEGETYKIPQNRIENIEFRPVRMLTEEPVFLKDKFDLILLWGINQFYSLPVVHKIIEKCIPLLDTGGILVPDIQKFENVREYKAYDILWVEKQFYYRRNDSAIIQKSASGSGVSVEDETPDNLYIFAMSQLLKGELNRAIDYTHKIFKKQVDHRKTIILKSIAQINLEDYSGALHTIQQAIMINPNDFDACLIKSFINMKRGKLRESLRELHRSINHFNFNRLYKMIPLRSAEEQLFFSRWLKIDNVLKKKLRELKSSLPKEPEFNVIEPNEEIPEEKEETTPASDILEPREPEATEAEGKKTKILEKDSESIEKEKEKLTEKRKPFVSSEKEPEETITFKAPETEKLIEAVSTVSPEDLLQLDKPMKRRSTKDTVELPIGDKLREFAPKAFKTVEVKKPPRKRTAKKKPEVVVLTEGIDSTKTSDTITKLKSLIPKNPLDSKRILRVRISGSQTEESIVEEVEFSNKISPTEALRREMSEPDSGMLEKFSKRADALKESFRSIVEVGREQKLTQKPEEEETPVVKDKQDEVETAALDKFTGRRIIQPLEKAVKAPVETKVRESEPIETAKKEEPVKEAISAPKQAEIKPEKPASPVFKKPLKAEVPEVKKVERKSEKARAKETAGKPQAEKIRPVAPKKPEVERKAPVEMKKPVFDKVNTKPEKKETIDEKIAEKKIFKRKTSKKKAVEKQEQVKKKDKKKKVQKQVKEVKKVKVDLPKEDEGLPKFAFKTIEEILAESETAESAKKSKESAKDRERRKKTSQAKMAAQDTIEIQIRETVEIPLEEPGPVVTRKEKDRFPIDFLKEVKRKPVIKKEEKTVPVKEEPVLPTPRKQPVSVPKSKQLVPYEIEEEPLEEALQVVEVFDEPSKLTTQKREVFEKIVKAEEELDLIEKQEKTSRQDRKQTKKDKDEASRIGVIIENTDTMEIKRAYMVKAREKKEILRKPKEIIRKDIIPEVDEEPEIEPKKPAVKKPKEIIRYVKKRGDKKYYSDR